MQLQASDRSVEAVEFATLLPRGSGLLRAQRLVLRLEVAVEIVAALQVAQATRKGAEEGPRDLGDDPV